MVLGLLGAGLRCFLILLDKRGGVMIGKGELFEDVWSGAVVEENTLQFRVSALRKVLGPGMVVTVHGQGYKYAGPASVEQGADAALAE